ncbi:hypothetical protein T440DRAFT_427208, partial [Plenodomus tracheiphilus IPT5]
MASDQFKPMPIGRWLLDFHASCPRCHHYHHAAKLKIDNTCDKSKVSPIMCENCKEHWVAFGGRNTTQLSLLSVLTAGPDPVEREVHRMLVQMVRSVTAVATPLLGQDLAANRDSALPEQNVTTARHSNAERVVFHVQAANPRPQRRFTFRPASVVGSMTRASHPITVRDFLATIKQDLAARFPRLRRSTTTPSTQCSKTAEDAQRGRQDASLASTTTAPEVVRSVPIQSGQPRQSETKDLSPEAQTFIAGLRDDPIVSMNNEDRIKWVRRKFTEFRMRRINADSLEEPILHDDISLASGDSLLSVQASQLGHPQSINYLLGSHLGQFDGVYAIDLTPHANRDSMSERTSEVTTAVGDDNLGIRAPWQGLLPHERRSSGSSRPLSIQSAPRSWQQSQELASNMAAARNFPSTRGRNTHRLSGGSPPRSSNE